MTPPLKPPPPRPTPAVIQKWLDYWTEVLRLRDWDIGVKLFRSHDAPCDAAGWCHHFLEHRIAKIGLLDPFDYEDDCGYDPEEILVHELLHLHFAPFEYRAVDAPEKTPQEQAINMIANALITIKRRNKAK